MKENRFDRLEIEVPYQAIKIVDESAFNIKQYKGFIESYTYEQKEPFYYRVCVRPYDGTSFIEFSGKSLMNDYPLLIKKDTIETCIQHINAMNICYIKPSLLMEKGIVWKCDVTIDIPKPDGVSIKDIYNNLSIRNNFKYSVTDINNNMFAIITNNVTKNKKSRLVIYEKGKEFQKATNKLFRHLVSNCQEQSQYFDGMFRFELNLNSMDRIRHSFKIEGPVTLKKLFEASVDPIKRFLEDAIVSDFSSQTLKKNSNNIKDLEHILNLCFHNWNPAEVEKTYREISCRGTNIKEKMIPVLKIHDRVMHSPLDDVDIINLKQLKTYIQYMVRRTLPSDDNFQSANLLNLYYGNENNSGLFSL